MKLSGAESLSAAGNIFLGQTEAPLLVKGYLDKISINQIGDFEKALLQTLNSKGSSIITSITKDKALTEKSEKDLQKIIEDLVSSFE